MKNNHHTLIALATLALLLTPALASAQRNPVMSGHLHNASYHDRTPHVHDHTPVAHH